jgi:hypothetical protein
MALQRVRVRGRAATRSPRAPRRGSWCGSKLIEIRHVRVRMRARKGFRATAAALHGRLPLTSIPAGQRASKRVPPGPRFSTPGSRHDQETPMIRFARSPLWLASTLAVTAALSLASTQAFSQEKKKLAFVVNAASDFWKLAEAGVKKAQKELPKYELQFKYPAQGTAALQNALMDDFIGRSQNEYRCVQPHRQAGSAVHDRQRRTGQQPHRLPRFVEHFGRRASR